MLRDRGDIWRVGELLSIPSALASCRDPWLGVLGQKAEDSAASG